MKAIFLSMLLILGYGLHSYDDAEDYGGHSRDSSEDRSYPSS